VGGGGYRGGFCEKLREASPVSDKPVSAGSKTDLPVAKAKPISEGGSTSVITYLRRGRKNCGKMAVKRAVRQFERNNSAGTKVSEEGGGGGAPVAGAETFPLQPVEQTMVRQAVPLQPMEVHSGANIHPCKEPHAGAGGCLKEAVTPWGAHTGAGPWQDLRTRGERSPRRSRFAGRACAPVGDPCWRSVFLRDYSPWKGPTLGQFVKNCTPWEGPTVEQFVKNCSLWEGLALEKFVENCFP